jgi:F-type H+-transporting ATPase subunit delta
MQFASRESLATARARFEERIADTSTAALRTVSDELFAIAAVLSGERVLRRHLGDPATKEQARRRLADTVFGGKVEASTLDVLLGLVAGRWSRAWDLVDAVEALAREAALAVAEREESLEDVEDELFRFGRILAAEPRLRDLLVDELAPAPDRIALLDRLLAEKARPATLTLLRQAVRIPRGRNLDAVVEHLAGLAAARRDRSVAHVTAAAALTDAQEQRLADALSRMYGRAVSVQVEVDPGILGGLMIRVGNEVINGSVAAKLAKAEQELSG